MSALVDGLELWSRVHTQNVGMYVSIHEWGYTVRMCECVYAYVKHVSMHKLLRAALNHVSH